MAAHMPEMKHEGHQGHEMPKGPRRQELKQVMHEEHGMKADHHAMMEQELSRRFLVSVIFTIPVLILSPTIQMFFGFTVPRFPGYFIMLFLFASVVVFYGGIFFYRGAVDAFKRRTSDMNVLVSIAVLAGYLYSIGAIFIFEGEDFFWEISTLVLALLFGHIMEMRAVRRSAGALRELAKLMPPTANKLVDGEIQTVQTEELSIGDKILIKPGEKVPIDSVVVDGDSSVNEAMITGESKPVFKTKEAALIGGTINGEGSLTAQVNKVGKDTAIAQIVKLVEEAQAAKPEVQKLADRAASYLTVAAVGVGIITFTTWTLSGAEVVFALTLAITVLVIACPHALGLAIPTVTSISTTLAANNGLLIREANALDKSKDMDLIIFDKTGTLTKGEFGVTDIVTDGLDENRLLSMSAAIEGFSEHTIAKGIVKEAQARGLQPDKATDFQAIPGKGARAMVDGRKLFVGSKRLLEQMNLTLSESDEQKLSGFASQGKTVIYTLEKDKVLGAFALADIIREESKEAVKGIKEQGIKVAMLTGDNYQTAEYVAGELGLDRFFAEVLPEDKSKKVQEVQGEGQTVAMVGDGINDAPALVQANIGIAIGSGTDVAIESADIVLVKNDPRDVLRLIKLSKATSRKMVENLIWATGYNVIAIPVAAGVLYAYGIFLRPEWGALLMATSSIIVVLNALLLRRIEL